MVYTKPLEYEFESVTNMEETLLGAIYMEIAESLHGRKEVEKKELIEKGADGGVLFFEQKELGFVRKDNAWKEIRGGFKEFMKELAVLAISRGIEEGFMKERLVKGVPPKKFVSETGKDDHRSGYKYAHRMRGYGG